MNRKPAMGSQSREPSPFRFVGIGFELVAPLLLGVFGGRWLDRKFGTEPWLFLTGAVLGSVAGMLNLVRRGLPRSGSGDRTS